MYITITFSFCWILFERKTFVEMSYDDAKPNCIRQEIHGPLIGLSLGLWREAEFFLQEWISMIHVFLMKENCVFHIWYDKSKSHRDKEPWGFVSWSIVNNQKYTYDRISQFLDIECQREYPLMNMVFLFCFE